MPDDWKNSPEVQKALAQYRARHGLPQQEMKPTPLEMSRILLDRIEHASHDLAEIAGALDHIAYARTDNEGWRLADRIRAIIARLQGKGE